jgi:hypothetical protein
MRSPTSAPYGARRALIAARSSVGVPPRFSPKGVFHPKGSASGQASWDAVCTGVTRLRLSQSRDAPPTPVMVPGDVMPKPPGSGRQIRPRAPHSLHLSVCLRKASLSERDLAPVRYLAALSRTNEIARGAFVSNGKHAAFARGVVDFARPLANGSANARATAKDSLAQS